MHRGSDSLPIGTPDLLYVVQVALLISSIPLSIEPPSANQPENRMRWPVLDLTVDYQGFYRSSDRWSAVVATIATGIVIGIDRFVIAGQSRESKDVPPAE